MSMTNLTKCTFGVKFKDFALIASCNTRVDSLVVYQDELTARSLGSRLALAVQGAQGVASRFLDVVAGNATLYEMRHRFPMSAAVAAHFVRKTSSDALRTASSFMVSAVLAGYEPGEGPKLYYLSELATLQEMPSMVSGLAGTLTWAQLDKHSGTGVSEADGYLILKGCVEQVTERYFINLSSFSVLVVDKEGVRKLPNICGKSGSSGRGDTSLPHSNTPDCTPS
ncbi:proteasome subunit beta type-2-like [Bacillus rossius redtenbacheri]|uniref:proteasome subunit beta type-2-like n=1 Tax=Bacillus rossius redtenbacheri TaxID=93214 RepID=UPI002FDD3C44